MKEKESGEKEETMKKRKKKSSTSFQPLFRGQLSPRGRLEARELGAFLDG